jgi:hypothetical protein
MLLKKIVVAEDDDAIAHMVTMSVTPAIFASAPETAQRLCRSRECINLTSWFWMS